MRFLVQKKFFDFFGRLFSICSEQQLSSTIYHVNLLSDCNKCVHLFCSHVQVAVDDASEVPLPLPHYGIASKCFMHFVN